MTQTAISHLLNARTKPNKGPSYFQPSINLSVKTKNLTFSHTLFLNATILRISEKIGICQQRTVFIVYQMINQSKPPPLSNNMYIFNRRCMHYSNRRYIYRLYIVQCSSIVRPWFKYGSSMVLPWFKNIYDVYMTHISRIYNAYTTLYNMCIIYALIKQCICIV